MKYLSIIVLCAACVVTASCGGYYFVGFVSNPGGGTTITGKVDSIQSGFVSDPGGVTPITSVTFMNSDSAFIVHFCGDQQHMFPINRTVRVEYNAGAVCSVLVQVVVVEEL